MPALTKLVQELLTAIQQTREAQEEAQHLALQIKSEGIPEIDHPPKSSQDLETVYRGYEIQAHLQQLRATSQDAMELINELIGLVLFIRSRVLATHENHLKSSAALVQDYRSQVNDLQQQHARIVAEKHRLVTLLQRKRHALAKARVAVDNMIEYEKRVESEHKHHDHENIHELNGLSNGASSTSESVQAALDVTAALDTPTAPSLSSPITLSLISNTVTSDDNPVSDTLNEPAFPNNDESQKAVYGKLKSKGKKKRPSRRR